MSEDTFQCGRCGAETYASLAEARDWHRDHANYACPADWDTRTLIRVTYEIIDVT